MRQFLIVSAVLALAQAHSPVVMWPAKQFELTDGHSPLEGLDADSFGKMISNQKIVVFAKKGFKLEDLSTAPKAPAYLESQELAALQSVHNLHGLLKQLVLAKNMIYHVLEDDDITKNDAEIQQFMEKYKDYAGMIVTTPIHAIHSRVARAAGDAPSPAICAQRGNGCGMVYIQTAKYATKDITSCSVECHDSGLILTLGEVKMNITSEKGGYNIELENHRIETDITWFPGKFSYSCGKFMAVKKDDDTKTLVLNRFQMYMTASNETISFPHDTWDCSVWLTTPIIMGLLVVLFYLFILFGAVLFLLDIKTNDRFDDPKGKTITVNVSE